MLFDSWYCSLDNLKKLRRLHWHWLTHLKENRRVNPDRTGLRPLNACVNAATGVWPEIAAKNCVYRDKAKQGRNSDSSFSTQFFAEPGNAADRFLRINTTGHVFEWLSLALSDDELRESWMEEAANALSLMILDAKDDPINASSICHAVHSLIIYYARRFDRQWLGPLDPPLPIVSATSTTLCVFVLLWRDLGKVSGLERIFRRGCVLIPIVFVGGHSRIVPTACRLMS